MTKEQRITQGKDSFQLPQMILSLLLRQFSSRKLPRLPQRNILGPRRLSLLHIFPRTFSSFLMNFFPNCFLGKAKPGSRILVHRAGRTHPNILEPQAEIRQEIQPLHTVQILSFGDGELHGCYRSLCINCWVLQIIGYVLIQCYIHGGIDRFQHHFLPSTLLLNTIYHPTKEFFRW